MRSVKRKIHEIISNETNGSLLNNLFEIFIVILIILNVFSIIIESCVNIKGNILKNFELFSVIFFSIEYILRIWTADLELSGKKPIKSRIEFILSPLGIVDLLSILPFYLAIISPITLDGRVLRVVRLLRLLRILKLSRFLDSFRIIKKVIIKRKNELLMTAFIAFILIVIASTLMFEIEHDAQPDKFSNIISSFWWAIATLTTIGYGDIFPVTGLGKFISAIVSLTGIGLIALPTGILSTSLIEEFRNNNKKEEHDIKNNQFKYCPHCGKRLDEEQ